MSNIRKDLYLIQQELKAPKDLKNNFGGYNYRSCESILEAVKPLLKKYELILLISDEIVNCCDRVYIKATATLYNQEDGEVSASALAREALTKKGMDESQITGAASSYARKYALNGLFAIDDTKDADATNTHDKTPKQVDYFRGLKNCKTMDELAKYFKSNYSKIGKDKIEEFTRLKDEMKELLGIRMDING